MVAPDETTTCCHQLEQSSSAESPAGTPGSKQTGVLIRACIVHKRTDMSLEGHMTRGITRGNVSAVYRGGVCSQTNAGFLIKEHLSSAVFSDSV